MFGRDGKAEAARRQGPATAPRRRRLWSASIFSALAITAIAGVLFVLAVPTETWRDLLAYRTPEEKVSAPKAEAPRKVDQGETTPRDPDAVRMVNLEALGQEQKIFDPVARSNRTAAIERAAALDREAGIARAQAAMETELKRINDAVAFIQTADPANEAEAARRERLLARYQAEAAAETEAFDERSRAVSRAVQLEVQRRLNILRGIN